MLRKNVCFEEVLKELKYFIEIITFNPSICTTYRPGLIVCSLVGKSHWSEMGLTMLTLLSGVP